MRIPCPTHSPLVFYQSTVNVATLLGKGGSVYLFFSVNGSGHFCGMAEMLSGVDYNSSAGVWAQDKWRGREHI